MSQRLRLSSAPQDGRSRRHLYLHASYNLTAAIDKLNDEGRRLANNRAELVFEVFQTPRQGFISHLRLPTFFLAALVGPAGPGAAQAA